MGVEAMLTSCLCLVLRSMTKTQPEDSSTGHAPHKDRDYGQVEPEPNASQISPDDPDYDLSESAGAADWLDDDNP